MEALLSADDGSPVFTLDDLVRTRGLDKQQTPLVAFPRTRNSLDDFEPVDGRTLNRFVNGAAEGIVKKGLEQVVCRP